MFIYQRYCSLINIHSENVSWTLCQRFACSHVIWTTITENFYSPKFASWSRRETRKTFDGKTFRDTELSLPTNSLDGSTQPLWRSLLSKDGNTGEYAILCERQPAKNGPLMVYLPPVARSWWFDPKLAWKKVHDVIFYLVNMLSKKSPLMTVWWQSIRYTRLQGRTQDFRRGGAEGGGGRGVPRSAKEANNPILLKVQSLQLSFRPAGVSLGGGGGGQGPPWPPPAYAPGLGLHTVTHQI